jgi:hypothetical protein
MAAEATFLFETTIAVIAAVISGISLSLVLIAQRRFTAGLVKQLVSGIVFVAANLFIYSVWLLLVLSRTVVMDSRLLDALPAIVVIILFLIVAVYTKKVADTYGFKH